MSQICQQLAGISKKKCNKLEELHVILLEPKRFQSCSAQANKKSVKFYLNKHCRLVLTCYWY